MTISDAFWDKRVDKYEADISNHDSVYEDRLRSLKNLLRDADEVLDFGCATGEISLDIARHVGNVCGIDLSERMIEVANRKALERDADNVHFRHSDSFDPSLERDSFSTILAFNVLHLVDDPRATLVQLRELLVKGGTLITETPCLNDRNVLIRSFVRIACAVGLAPPIHGFSADDLERLVSEAGFAIQESRPFDRRNGTQWLVAARQ